MPLVFEPFSSFELVRPPAAVVRDSASLVAVIELVKSRTDLPRAP